jgi:hypothetical protein
MGLDINYIITKIRSWLYDIGASFANIFDCATGRDCGGSDGSITNAELVELLDMFIKTSNAYENKNYNQFKKHRLAFIKDANVIINRTDKKANTVGVILAFILENIKSEDIFSKMVILEIIDYNVALGPDDNVYQLDDDLLKACFTKSKDSIKKIKKD